jgi:hypothetical protein
MKRLSIVVVTAALVVGLSGAFAATGGPYTKGDAEAMLNNYPPGNKILDRLEPDGVTRALVIRPFQDFYGDLTYCPQDWHVLALLWDIAEFVAPTAGVVFTAPDARAFLAGLDATFTLDGMPVAVEKTPIKRHLSPFDPDGLRAFLVELFGPDVVLGQFWATQWGRVLAPDDLSVGEHTLRVIVTETVSASVFSDGSVTFTVSPADSPACTD